MCLSYLIAQGQAGQSTDWGRELYYLNKYGTDLFGQAGEETREAYEQLLKESETDPRIDKEFLRYIWHRHAHIGSFHNWRPDACQSQPFSEAAFDEWWCVVSSAAYVREGLASFADAWVGSIRVLEGSQFLKGVREEGRLTTFDDVALFYEQFHLSLFPPE